MGTPFIAEIRMCSFNFAPKNWAMCNGQILPINQNQALFSILGTTYGGNGQTTFALPDLRGRTPMHIGGSIALGQRAGEESHTLTIPEMPQHTHGVPASPVRANLDDPTPTGPTPPNVTVWAADQSVNRYSSATPNGQMSPAMFSSTGGSQAHPNLQPFLVINFVIALVGIFPSRN